MTTVDFIAAMASGRRFRRADNAYGAFLDRSEYTVTGAPHLTAVDYLSQRFELEPATPIVYPYWLVNPSGIIKTDKFFANLADAKGHAQGLYRIAEVRLVD